MKTALALLDRGWIPEPLVRRGIRKLLRERLDEQAVVHGSNPDQSLERFLEKMRAAQVALVPEKANEQHYEVTPEFFQVALGPHLKYSSAYFESPETPLAEAERRMLELTCERALLEDGQDILELGCGWGSLTMWMAEHYPNSRITAVSNSAPQREFLEQRFRERGVTQVTVLTRDMNEFEPEGDFDRIVSVEMFEHMRNWETLLERLAPHLRDDGKLFLHIFVHRKFAYTFEVRDETDWMSRYFFSGGMMPSYDLTDRLKAPLGVEQSWEVSGVHYAQTAEAWHRNLESRRSEALRALADTYPAAELERWYQRWRVFFLSCAELFGYDGGAEWFVAHKRFTKRP